MTNFCIQKCPRVDVIPGVAVDNVGMDVHIKFVDSRLNGFHFVSNKRTNKHKMAHSNSVRNANAFRLIKMYHINMNFFGIMLIQVTNLVLYACDWHFLNKPIHFIV